MASFPRFPVTEASGSGETVVVPYQTPFMAVTAPDCGDIGAAALLAQPAAAMLLLCALAAIVIVMIDDVFAGGSSHPPSPWPTPGS